MRRKFVVAALSMALLFSSSVTSVTAKDYPKADFTWQFVQGQTFEVTGKEGTTYEILTPGMTRIISQKGDVVTFSLDKKGDVYVLAHQPGEDDFLYHLIVGGEENRTVIEHHVEHRVHHVTLSGNTPDNVDVKQYAQRVLDLVNQERRHHGVVPLRLSKDLMEAASIRADEITQSFSHTRPNGKPCSSLIKNGTYTVGENIAAGSATPEAVVEQWMNSPGHRANILNSDYDELGVGYAYKSGSEYGHYWVQMFRRPMSKAIRRW